jgi:hypothetical protein
MTSSIIENSLIFSPESDPYGLSYAEWTAKWWQWVLSLPVEINPVKDTTGKNSAIKQNGPVWFLAGTIGGVVRRFCTVPSDRAILLPILNHGGTLADTPYIKLEKELLSHAITEMDVVSNLEVSVDNVKINGLKRHRIKSPIFDVVLPEQNLFGGTAGPTRGASDGYWLFLKPLSKGVHRIHSFGSCLSGKIRIGVYYDITIF